MKLHPLLPVVLVPVLVWAVAGCKPKPPPDEPSHTAPRTDFTPEEFGVGRPHTKSAACNREIDQLLDQVRRCYNSRPAAECERQQQANSERVARYKNSERCSR